MIDKFMILFKKVILYYNVSWNWWNLYEFKITHYWWCV